MEAVPLQTDRSSSAGRVTVRDGDPSDAVPIRSGLISVGPHPGSRHVWSLTLSSLSLQRPRLRGHAWAPRAWLCREGGGGILAGCPTRPSTLLMERAGPTRLCHCRGSQGTFYRVCEGA